MYSLFYILVVAGSFYMGAVEVWVILGGLALGTWGLIPKKMGSRVSVTAFDSIDRLEGLPFGLVELSGDQEVLYANSLARDWLRFSRDDISKKEILDFANTDWRYLSKRRLKEESPIERVYKRKRPLQNVIIGIGMHDVDPSEKQWLQINAEPIFGSQNEVKRVLLSIVDVTWKIQQEQMIREQNEQLMESQRLSGLGIMASGLSHEINNPLAIIKGRADILYQKASKKKITHEDMCKELLGMERNIIRISQIVSSMRQFSGDTSRTVVEDVEVREIIDGALEFCRERMKKHNIELQIGDIPASLTVHCRWVEVTQALFNVIANAHDAAVDSQPSWVRIETIFTNDDVEILISDSGSGIPKENRAKIMMPFYTTKPPNMGQGIGLSVASRLVASHDGRLYLDESRHNTTFVMRLPRHGRNNMLEDTITAA